MRKIILFSVLFLFSFNAFSQDFSNKGKEFWLTYPAHNAGTTSRMALYLTSDQSTTGTVEFNGNTIPFAITANQTTVVRIGNATVPSNAGCYIGSNNVIEVNKGIHITAIKPIVAYAHILNSAVSGSSLLLPKSVLGREYVVSSYVPQGSTAGVERCQFAIVGVENNTTVEIRPTSGDISGVHPAGVSFQIVLNKGDVYQFQSNGELSGSTVKSIAAAGSACQKIVVFGSTTRSAIGCAGAGSGDNLFQQLLPTPAWGRSYITVPFATRNHDIVRVYVSNPLTPVTVNGTPLAIGTLINGSYYEFNANAPQQIVSADPIAVYQYIITQNCDGISGDPEMVLINSTEQTLKDITVVSAERTLTPPNTNITSHFLNIIIKNEGSALTSLRIDGAVPVVAFNPVGATSYVYAQVNVTGTTTAGSPSHRITSDSGFVAIAYGFGNVESYGYNAGTFVKDPYQQIKVATQYGIEESPSICTNAPFRFKVSLPYCTDSIRWDLTNLPGTLPSPTIPVIHYSTCLPPPAIGGPDSVTVVNGKSIYWYSLPYLYNFSTTGSFPITITTYSSSTGNPCGNEQDIDFDLEISNPPVPGFTEVIPGCYLEPVQFIETTPQTPKATYRWYWDFGDGNTTTGKNPSHTYAAPGTYTVRYASITTPGCLSDTIQHTVTIPGLPTAVVSHNTDTVCINTAIPPTIVFTGTDGKAPYEFSYNLNGVPQTPVTSNAAGTYSFTAPVNLAGQFIYKLTSIKNVGSTVCTQSVNNEADTVTVLPNSTITLTSATGTPIQTVCINTPIIDITYAVGGSGNGGTVTGLPTGVTGTYAGGIITITGTPTVSGTFNYSVNTLGPCANISSGGTLTVNADATIALTSAVGTDNQTLCVNNPITVITYAVGGSGNGGTVTGLPAGVNGTYAGGIVTITGTPTVSGTFNYTVATTGPCVKPTATGTITVTADATLLLTSAAGTDNQTVCINNAITNITYAVGGTGTGGTVTGLPAGLTGTFAGGIITITGTPTVSGTFNYSVSTTGPCIKPSATGTITVTADATLLLTSAAGTDNQTICINTPLTAITYSVGGSGNGGTVTGLPAGLTGIYAGGIISITGAPTVSGTFNYTVTTTGPCIKPTASGTVTVTADATLTLTSAAGTNNQTVCINNAITNITYAVGGTGNGGAVTGLSAGLTGTYVAGIITITGTPTVSGTFNFTVSTTGPCVKPSATGTIIVTADATLALTSAPATANQAMCLNTALVNITYATGGTATGATVTGLPAGITGVYAGGIVTISGTATVSGTFNYTVTTTGPCVKPTASGTITIRPLPTPDFLTTTPLCETRDIAFTDNSNPQVGTLTGWAWNFGDPASGVLNTSTATNPVHNYTTAGNYTVTLTVTTSNGCSNAVPFTRTITINDRPKAGFIVPEVCINDVAAVFIDTSKIANGTLSPAGYEWNYGDPPSGINNTSNGMNGSHLYTLVGPYNVRHVVTSTLGCKDTVVNTIFINGANPVADFSVSNPATLCANDSIAITNLSTISQGSITKVEIYWDWVGAPATVQVDDFPAPGKVYRHKYPNFQAPLTLPYTIRFVAYSGTLCLNAKNTPITVNAAPKVQFNNMPDVCYDAAPFLITQGSEIGGVPGTFAYTGPGIVNANGLFNPVVAGIGTHVIRYTFTSTAAGCVDTASKTIKVIDTASAKFSFSAPTCEGSITTFKEESTAPAAVTLNNTVWNFGDGSPIENHAPGTTFTHTYAAWGSYTVTMYNTSAYGCRSVSKQQTVYVSPIPNPVFAFGQTSVCIPNADVSFINTSSIADGTENAFTYLWDMGDPASGVSNTSLAKTPPPHHYTGIGPYTVTLTVTSGTGCPNTTTRQVNFIHPQPKTVFNFNKPSVCIGDNVVMTDVTDGLDGTITQWFWKFSDGGTGNTKQVPYTFTAPKTYDVSLYTVNSHGCNSDTVTKQFTVYAYPTVDAGPDRVVLEGGSITIEPVVTGNGLQYLWTPNTYLNNDRIERPTAANMLDDITYTLTVTGEGGCTAPSDKMFVKVLKAPKVPNTFTPNGDGINETWKIEYLDTYPNCKVQVFTRTGQLVFESKGYKTPWDGRYNGKALPFDTYYYIIEPENGRKPVTGYVTIVK